MRKTKIVPLRLWLTFAFEIFNFFFFVISKVTQIRAQKSWNLKTNKDSGRDLRQKKIKLQKKKSQKTGPLTSKYKTEKIKKMKKEVGWDAGFIQANGRPASFESLLVCFCFCFFFFNKLNPVLAGIYISAEIVQNDPNGPKQPEIWPEVEREVFWYWFAYRYEKFRPFWPKWNSINNNG